MRVIFTLSNDSLSLYAEYNTTKRSRATELQKQNMEKQDLDGKPVVYMVKQGSVPILGGTGAVGTF